MSANDSPSSDYVALAAEVVSAFVGHNSLPVSELPGLITSVHAALVKISGGTAAPMATEPEVLTPAVPVRKSDHTRLPGLSGRRPQVQVAQAASCLARHDSRPVSRQMEPAGGLSDGRLQLRRDAFGARQEDRPRPEPQARLKRNRRFKGLGAPQPKRAKASISTFAPNASPLAPNAERAGRRPGVK